MRPPANFDRHDAGMTLVELSITVAILGTVLLIVSSVFLSTSRLQSRTVRRAEVQMSSHQGLSLMTTEIRQAGADPADPQIGVIAIVEADTHRVRVRSDLNGDGVLQTAEPSEDVTYTFDAVAGEVLRDPGSGPEVVIPSVAAMRLTYFDATGTQLTVMPLSATDAALVRSVAVTITSQDRDAQAITLSTRIMLRNL